DDVELQPNQLAHERREPLELPVGGSELDLDRLALDVTEVTQSLTKGLRQLRACGQVGRHITDARDLGHLLGLTTKWSGEEAAGQHPNEGSARRHWMISSARPSSDGGIVRPRALAVLRLMMNSNFVGCSTGRSAGFAPLRILST